MPAHGVQRCFVFVLASVSDTTDSVTVVTGYAIAVYTLW
jgi:hypothetical protein